MEQVELKELRLSNERLRLENAALRERLADGGAAESNGNGEQNAEQQPSRNRRCFLAFLRGVGSMLEVFPNPGRFDRWRIKDTIPENEFALLFRELCAPADDEKKDDGAGT